MQRQTDRLVHGLNWGPLCLTFVTGLLFTGLTSEVGMLAVWMAFAAAPLFVLLLNFRVAFLLLVALIPNLGEIELDHILPLLWMAGFVPLIGAWMLTLVFRPSEIELPLIPTFLFTILFLSVVVSHFGGYDLAPLALVRHARNWPYWPSIDFFSSFAIGFIAMTVFRDEKDLKNIYLVFMVSGIPYAITIFFFGHEIDPLTGVVESRTQGFYGHPHMASTHMIVCTILAANYARYARGVMRWFSVGCAILFLATLGFATSKTTVAAIPVVIFIWVAMELDVKRALLGVSGIIAILFLLFPVLSNPMKRDLAIIAEALVGNSAPHAKTLPGEGRLNTFKERFIQIREGVDLIKARPWFGYGPGRIPFVSKIPSRFAGPQIHNYYVQIYVALGIIGGTLFVTLLLTVLLFGFFYTLELRGDPVWHLVRGLFLSTVMVALIVTLNSGSVGSRIIWCSLGLLAGTGRLLHPSPSVDGKGR